METVKTTRGRGRPRKVAAEPENYSEVAQDSVQTEEYDEVASMREDFKVQFSKMLEMAERMGLKLEDIYDKPPTHQEVERINALPEIQERKPTMAERQGRLRPGTVVGEGKGAYDIPWSKADLDPADQITFTPHPVPSLVFPLEDADGFQKILLDVNGLKCWLTCGVPNTVNLMFFYAYKNAYDQWKELEAFKRNGPQIAPWGERGPDGRPAWMYKPGAVFGMDEDGMAVGTAGVWREFLNPNLGEEGSDAGPGEGDAGGAA